MTAYIVTSYTPGAYEPDTAVFAFENYKEAAECAEECRPSSLWLAEDQSSPTATHIADFQDNDPWADLICRSFAFYISQH